MIKNTIRISPILSTSFDFDSSTLKKDRNSVIENFEIEANKIVPLFEKTELASGPYEIDVRFVTFLVGEKNQIQLRLSPSTPDEPHNREILKKALINSRLNFFL